MTQRRTLGILVGGGPAPGINSVISAATIRAALEGYTVLGIEEGFAWLMQGDATHVRPLTLDGVDWRRFKRISAGRECQRSLPCAPLTHYNYRDSFECYDLSNLFDEVGSID